MLETMKGLVEIKKLGKLIRVCFDVKDLTTTEKVIVDMNSLLMVWISSFIRRFTLSLTDAFFILRLQLYLECTSKWRFVNDIHI